MIAKNNFEKEPKEHLKIKVIVIDIKILNVILERILKKTKKLLKNWKTDLEELPRSFSAQKNKTKYIKET